MAGKTPKTATGSYANRLSISKEAKDAASTARNVKAAGIQLQRDIFDCETIVAGFEAEVETLKNAYPLNSKAVIAAQFNLETAEANLAALNALNAELFGG